MLNPFLKTFRCVAKCGSFNKAASELFLSATAVRKQMDSLESELGLRLFNRDKKGIRLTGEGKIFYGELGKLFELSQQILELAKEKKRQTGMFRIGSSLLNPATMFINLLRHLDEFKNFSVQLVQFDDDREGILSEIEKLGVNYDFLVGACGSRAWLKRCEFYKLGDYAMCCAIPHGHKLYGKKALSLDDLHGERIVLGKRGDSPFVDKVRDALEKKGNIILEDTYWFYDLHIFNECEREKKLLLTLECWDNIHPGFATVPVDWDYAMPFGILYPKNPSDIITDFISALEKARTREDFVTMQQA